MNCFLTKYTLEVIILTSILLSCNLNYTFSQSAAQSESLIKYDILTHQTDKPIPFDKAFTLVVENLSSKGIKTIDVFEVENSNGRRSLKIDRIEKYSDQKLDSIALSKGVSKDSLSIKQDEFSDKDFSVSFAKDIDTLYMYFPPIKPKKEFDINLVYVLPEKQRNLLLNVNKQIIKGKKISENYTTFWISTLDPHFNRTYTENDHNLYIAEFKSNIQSHYDTLTTHSFNTENDLTIDKVQALGVQFKIDSSEFKNLNLLYDIISKDLLDKLQLGYASLNKSISYDLPFISKVDTFDISKRSKSLKESLGYFTELINNSTKLLAAGVDTIFLNSNPINLISIHQDLYKVRSNISNNSKFIESQLKHINSKIDKLEDISYGVYLAGNTISSDLKTSGGTLLFLDGGLSNITTLGLRNEFVQIPKLNWGFSIYFKPIDKNTRTGKFPSKDSLEELKRDRKGDQNIKSRKTILNNLSLNLGLTLGTISKTNFDSFINGSSLLIGPALRFKRGMKLSAGLSLLNRTSKNPLESEKQIYPGIYSSFTVDIDFINGLTEIKNIFFK